MGISEEKQNYLWGGKKRVKINIWGEKREEEIYIHGKKGNKI